jgi:hypothetical protein
MWGSSYFNSRTINTCVCSQLLAAGAAVNATTMQGLRYGAHRKGTEEGKADCIEMLEAAGGKVWHKKEKDFCSMAALLEVRSADLQHAYW